MNMHLRHTPPFLFARPLLGAGALVLGLMLSSCGGGGGGSDTAAGQSATCGSPDTHCAPQP